MTRLEIRACYPANFLFIFWGIFNFFFVTANYLKGERARFSTDGDDPRNRSQATRNIESTKENRRWVQDRWSLYTSYEKGGGLIVDLLLGVIEKRQQFHILTCHPKHFPIPRRRVTCMLKNTRVRIFKLLRSPRIESKEPIQPGCVALPAGIYDNPIPTQFLSS